MGTSPSHSQGKDNRGIIPRVLEAAFQEIEASSASSLRFILLLPFHVPDSQIFSKKKKKKKKKKRRQCDQIEYNLRVSFLEVNWDARQSLAALSPLAAGAIFFVLTLYPENRLQIYQENLKDLLGDKKSNNPLHTPSAFELAIREDKSGGIHVAGLREFPVRTVNDALEYAALLNSPWVFFGF
jgi:hypothetical protein